MTMDPLFTIAIPAYKKKYLSIAIDSVLAQTVSNFELVVVNDCSPENIDEVLEQYHDDRIRYFKNPINLGRESIVLNWNKCLEYARGTYFTLLCDDDIMDSQFLQKMYTMFEKYTQSDIVRCQTNYFSSIENVFFGNTAEWNEYEDFETYLTAKLKGKRKHTISEFLIRTSVLNEVGGYISFPVGYYSDDASVLRLASHNGMISYNEPLITFRKSYDNITTNCKYNYDKCKAALQYYIWLEEFLKKTALSEYNLKQKLDYDLYEYFINCSNWKLAINIVDLVPMKIWPPKTKFCNLYTWIRKYYF